VIIVLNMFNNCYNTASQSSASGSAGAVIGGAVGVVVITLIIVLCIVVVLVRWSKNKTSYAVGKDRVYDEPSANTAVFTSPNPAYKSDSKEYDYIKDNEVIQYQDGIKMESNPSYELPRGVDSIADVIIQPNPSYDVLSSQRKISEEQYGNMEYNNSVPSEISFHAEDTTVKMEDNPSYSITSRKGNTNLGSDIIIIPNPSYNAVDKFISKEETSDYDYVHTDML